MFFVFFVVDSLFRLADQVVIEERMCPGTELNCRHVDFQSTALPTELPGRRRLELTWKLNKDKVLGISIVTYFGARQGVMQRTSFK